MFSCAAGQPASELAIFHAIPMASDTTPCMGPIRTVARISFPFVGMCRRINAINDSAIETSCMT
jgi:hypothetical protein